MVKFQPDMERLTNVSITKEIVSVAQRVLAGRALETPGRRRFWLRGYALGQVQDVSKAIRRSQGRTDLQPKIRLYYTQDEALGIVRRIKEIGAQATIRGRHLRDHGMGPDSIEQVEATLLSEPH